MTFEDFGVSTLIFVLVEVELVLWDACFSSRFPLRRSLRSFSLSGAQMLQMSLFALFLSCGGLYMMFEYSKECLDAFL